MLRSLDAHDACMLVYGFRGHLSTGLGELYSVEMGQELTVTSPQTGNNSMLCLGQVCDIVFFSVMAQLILPVQRDLYKICNGCL